MTYAAPGRPSTSSLGPALLLVLALLVAALAVVGGAAPARAAAQYSAPIAQAVTDLPVATEVRTGYDRTLFRHWIDADGDGCDTRDEVLLAEADDAPSVGSGCSISGGRWYSYYDGVSQTSASNLDIDHVVPLAEAWDSGARTWSASERQAFANDLGDSRSLVAVTSSVNRAKGDQDPADWVPSQQRCRYVAEWLAVKHRWRLSVDSRERSALSSYASGCSGRTVTVTLAR